MVGACLDYNLQPGLNSRGSIFLSSGSFKKARVASLPSLFEDSDCLTVVLNNHFLV